MTVPLRFPDGYATTARVFTFDGLVDGREHLALGLGDWAGALDRHAAGGTPPLVRPHSECLTGDVFGSQRCDCGPQLREAVERIAEAGGFLLYLRQEGRGIGLYAKLDAYALQDAGLDTYEANVALGRGEDERDYTAAAQMLAALGVPRVALLSNNPDKAEQLTRLGVTVAERVPTGRVPVPGQRRLPGGEGGQAARRRPSPLDLPSRGRDRSDPPVRAAQLRDVDRRLHRRRHRPSGCCCPTTTTWTGSTRSGPGATRSWSARAPSGATTPGCWCAPPAPGRAGGAGPAAVAGEGHGHRAAATSTRRPGSSPPATRRSWSTARAARWRRPGSGSARLATVVDAGEPVDPDAVLADLAARGVRRLMVEGGGTVHAQFLTAGLADELHLVVAPFFVGDGRAPRFVGEGASRGIRAAAPGWSRSARSATWC